MGNVESFLLSSPPFALVPSGKQAALLTVYRHEFEWKREECFIIRKPDPPVLVAVTKEPPGRMKTQSVQILDYNLNR
jgi:hypothetical protein